MIVIAPILVVWFGFGIGPKVAIIALICFFPIAVNTLDGLGTVPAELRKLMRSLGAGRLRVLTMLEAPTALPFVISGAKIAAAVAVIGAVFGEWAGANEGLGHLMLVDNAQLEVPRLFAAMVWLSAMAIALFALLEPARAADRLVGRAERRPRGQAEPTESTLAPSRSRRCVAALAVAGCGGGGATGGDEPFDLALDFYVNPDHAGIYTALERGYFEDAGLDVDPPGPLRSRRRRSSRSPPGAPTSRSPTSPRCCSPATRASTSSRSRRWSRPADLADLAAGGRNRRSPADLAGKTVATAGIPYQADYLETILERAGVDPDDASSRSTSAST